MNDFVSMLSKDKPHIFNGLGIGAFAAAIWAAWELSPMAKDAIEDKKKRLEVNYLPFKEVICTSIPFVIPVVVLAGTGTGLILASSYENVRRQAAAVAACTISEATSQLYREKVKEIVGERKEKEIHEAAAKDTYYKDLNEGRILVVSGKSEGYYMYDTLTKQKFKSNIEKVHSVINDLNRRMLSSTVTMDEYCLFMGEQPMELGNILGWDVDHGYIELEPFTAIVNEEGEPEIVITHRNIPHKLY